MVASSITIVMIAIAASVVAQVPRHVGPWAVAYVLNDAHVLNPAEGLTPSLRVGIRNTTQDARLICIVSAGYVVEHADVFASPIESGSHSCSDVSQFALTLPGETHFVQIPAESNELNYPPAKLSIHLFLADAPYTDGRRIGKRTLDWTGTVEQANAAARMMSR